MLLVITNSKDTTADYLCGYLGQACIEFLRLDSDLACDTVTVSYNQFRPSVSIGNRLIHPEEVSHVWLRRPQPLVHHTVCDSSQYMHIRDEWSEAIEGFLAHIDPSRWINHPSANVAASHKIEQLSRALRFGLAVPNTLVTQDRQSLQQFWERCKGNVILKPLASGYISRQSQEEDTLIYTNYLSESDIENPALSACPTLFQQAIQKTIDVRVTIVDSHVHAVSLVSPESESPTLDIRRDNMEGVKYAPIPIPDSVTKPLLSYLRSYNLRFAAVDFVLDSAGQWIFLEVNPNGQWAWLDLVGASDIAKLFIEVLSSKADV
jgi:glutathione synthase/RimK-type ligase-like ATP-grasp enzyme